MRTVTGAFEQHAKWNRQWNREKWQRTQAEKARAAAIYAACDIVVNATWAGDHALAAEALERQRELIERK